MRLSEPAQVHPQKERTYELKDAIQELSRHFFTLTRGEVATVYPSWVNSVVTYPTFPSQLLWTGRRTLMYPLAYRAIADPKKDPKEIGPLDFTLAPYAWITHQKKLILSNGGHYYFVKPGAAQYWVHETLIERIILSLNDDDQALDAVYIEEGEYNIMHQFRNE